MRLKICKEFVLTISEHEAEWLKSVMQHPLNGIDHAIESKHDKDIRHSFFELLKGGTKL